MIDALISADSHVVPLPTFWRDYFPARWRDHAPRVESTDAGDVVVFEGRRTPVMAINSIAGKTREGQGLRYRRFSEQVPGGHDPHARLRDQDRDGIIAELLYGARPVASHEPDLLDASALAYDELLAHLSAFSPHPALRAA